MRISLRQSKDCKNGSQWYTCSTSSFTGCCSVDPCNPSGCPDGTLSATSSSTLKPSRTVTLEIIKPTSSVQTTTTGSTVTPAPESSQSNGSAIGSSLTRAGSVVEGAANTAPAAASPSSTQSKSSVPSFSSKAPIIAGSAAGLVALITIAILVWFCVRRSRQRKASRASSRSPLSSSKESDSFVTSNDDGEDVFAPFGGYHKPAPVQEPRVSPSRAKRPQERSAPANPAILKEDLEDVPLPDPEKSSFTAPPILDHPALHLLPGQSPKVPVYHPGVGVVVSPELATNPVELAKHLTLLEEHPALRSSKTGPVSFSTHAGSKSHPALENHISQSLVPKSKADFVRNTPADIPSQGRGRKHSISRTASIHNHNTPPYNPTYTTYTVSIDSKPKRDHALNKPLSLPQLSSKPRSLLKHSSLPTILSLPSELPADVPQELDSNVPSNLSRLSRGDTTSTQTSTYSIPIGLGLENSPSFYIRNTAPLESVVEREPMPSANARHRPSTPPLQPLSAVTSPGMISPEFNPSPQSMFGKSPEAPSEQYAHYVVSPVPVKTPTNSTSQFTSFHSSPSPPAPAPGLFQSRKYRRFPPPQLQEPKSSPIQEVHNSNTASSLEHANLPMSAGPQFHIPMPRPKPKAKPSLGKGKEHAMAWATYRNNSNGDTSTNSTTPGSTSDSKSLYCSSPAKLPPVFPAQGNAESRLKEAADAVEGESPILGTAFTRPRNEYEYAYRSSAKPGTRSNRGTMNDRRPVRAQEVTYDTAGTREADGPSMKSRSQELEDRWSGSTALTTSQAQLLEAVGAGTGAGFGAVGRGKY